MVVELIDGVVHGVPVGARHVSPVQAVPFVHVGAMHALPVAPAAPNHRTWCPAGTVAASPTCPAPQRVPPTALVGVAGKALTVATIGVRVDTHFPSNASAKKVTLAVMEGEVHVPPEVEVPGCCVPPIEAFHQRMVLVPDVAIKLTVPLPQRDTPLPAGAGTVTPSQQIHGFFPQSLHGIVGPPVQMQFGIGFPQPKQGGVGSPVQIHLANGFPQRRHGGFGPSGQTQLGMGFPQPKQGGVGKPGHLQSGNGYPHSKHGGVGSSVQMHSGNGFPHFRHGGVGQSEQIQSGNGIKHTKHAAKGHGKSRMVATIDKREAETQPVAMFRASA